MDSGMPSWSKSIDQIAEKLSLDENDKPYDSLKVSQYYFNSRGKKEYTQLMRQIFRYGDSLQTGELHKKIVEFHAQVIITTNYDHLIEQSSEENGEFRYIISKDADLPYRNSKLELINENDTI